MSNDCTTNNYKKLAFPSLMKGYDKIIIPMIQRDYAHGRTDKKAQEVRANLLNDIFDEEKKSIHFDLIFGSCEKRHENGKEKQCFIPVDGQQRLTTLFLLYLYAQKTEQHIEGVDLSKFSYDTRRAAADFCEKVTSEEWTIVQKRKVSDIIKDSVWFMNYWENDPTVAGMLNMLDAIHEKAEGRPLPTLEKIQFYFFDLESNGLNENLYLKMNSRGKPLTAFENLKASIEKVLPNNLESDDTNNCFPDNSAAPESFKDKWKFFMDRDWINIFWDSDHPESTDTNITTFIVRFLSGFWNAFGDEDMTRISKSLQEINNQEKNYADFIPFECIKPILCLDGVFAKLASAFNELKHISTINNYWSNVDKYYEYKTIAIIFSYVVFDGESHAMHFACNMSENTVTGYDTFIAYCKRVAEILKYRKNEEHANKDFYEVLSSIKFDNPSAQLIEEVTKAKQILFGESRSDGKTWEEIIQKEAEQFAFFKGSIRFLFLDADGNPNWANFDIKWENAKRYFDTDGVKDDNTEGIKYKSEAKLLKYLISNFNTWNDFWGIDFDNSASTWKKILISNRYFAIDKILMSYTISLNHYESILKPTECDDIYKQISVQKELVTTNLLEHISKSSRLNWRYGNYCLYPYNTKSQRNICIIANKRNRILSSLCHEGIISTDHTIENTDYFWGWDIYFSYTKNENLFEFQWNTDNHVYLIENGKWVVKDDETDEKYDIYFCFDASAIKEKEDFRTNLDELIELASKVPDCK